MTSEQITQLTREELAALSPEERLKAAKDGRVNILMGMEAPPVPPSPDQLLTRADLASLTHQEILQAGHEGRLDHLMKGERA